MGKGVAGGGGARNVNCKTKPISGDWTLIRLDLPTLKRTQLGGVDRLHGEVWGMCGGQA
jgi:hypothetical protein